MTYILLFVETIIIYIIRVFYSEARILFVILYALFDTCISYYIFCMFVLCF